MGLRWYHIVLWLGFIAFMFSLPEFLPRGTLRTLIFANFVAVFAISWDVLSGRTGYISFGHPFLIGVGGYATAIMSKRYGIPVEISIPSAVFITIIAGTLMFLPALRVRGSYFALVTLALMELMYQLVQVIRPDLTGGTRGMSGIPSLTRGAVNGYYMSLSLMLAVAVSMWLLMRTQFGTALSAIGMNMESVRGSGLNTTKIKLVAFMLSALIAGLGGAIYAHYLGTIAPRAWFGIDFLFTILVAALLGGASTIIGPIIGAFFLTLLLEYLRPILPGTERYFIYGGLALALYMYEPKGIYHILTKRLPALARPKKNRRAPT